MDRGDDLKQMIMSFRVAELHTLLSYANKSKYGRKPELQARALELIKGSKGLIMSSKVREIYRTVNMTSSSSSGGAENYLREFTYAGGPYGGASNDVLQGRPTFGAAGYGSSSSSFGSYLSYQMSVPICPDVKFKKLPFFDVVCELIKPTTLVGAGSNLMRLQDGSFPFYLTPQQILDIKASKNRCSGPMDEPEYKTQVQLRFCLLDTNGEQTDNFPPSICVKVNGRLIDLPPTVPSHRQGVDPKRPSKPLDITSAVRLNASSGNSINVTWVADGSGREWVMSLHLVKKLTASELLGRVKQRGARPAEFTKGMIKEIVNKDDGDCQIAMTSLQVSVMCPLGKCRMSLPCRATTCTHLQCFDATLFLQMNERKPTWTCPVCDKHILFENLAIDGYFQEVIGSLSFDGGNEIEVYPDGTWMALVKIKQEKTDDAAASRPKKRKFEPEITICLDDDDNDDESPSGDSSGMPILSPQTFVPPPPQPYWAHAPVTKRIAPSTITSANQPSVIDLTVSDSESDDDPMPVPPVRPFKIRKNVIHDDTSSSDSGSQTTKSSSSSSSSSSSDTQNDNNEDASGGGDGDSETTLPLEPSDSSPQRQIDTSERTQDTSVPSTRQAGSPDIICLDSPEHPSSFASAAIKEGNKYSHTQEWLQSVSSHTSSNSAQGGPSASGSSTAYSSSSALGSYQQQNPWDNPSNHMLDLQDLMCDPDSELYNEMFRDDW